MTKSSALNRAIQRGDMRIASHILVLAGLRVLAREAHNPATSTPSATASTHASSHQKRSRRSRKPTS